VPNLVEVALGTGGKVTLYNFNGPADVVLDVAGYVSAPELSPGPDGFFNPLVPSRLLDTRDGTGGFPIGPLSASSSLALQVTGRGGVPSTGVSAVVLNVTVTGPTAHGFVTVWPDGGSRPLASNLNFVPGQTVPNRVIVKVGTGGRVDFYNLAGTADLVADVGGYFTDSTVGGRGARFVGLTPTRILDTRDGTGGYPVGPIGPDSSYAVNIWGAGGVVRGATAVVANVTVANPTAPGFLTAWPSDAPRPTASDLNFVPGQTVPNLVVVKIGIDGKIKLYNLAGTTDAVVDVVGYYV
jgi:hypothetical protein